MTNTLQHVQENIHINGELEIILNTILNQDYTYYFVPAPWLSVKLLRLLQNYQPPEDPGVHITQADTNDLESKTFLCQLGQNVKSDANLQNLYS